MPLVRSECLLMTSFTNNKPCNQAGKHTAQQDLSFIPVWQWTEGKKDGGRGEEERWSQGGIRKHGDEEERAGEEKVLAKRGGKKKKEEMLKWKGEMERAR